MPLTTVEKIARLKDLKVYLGISITGGLLNTTPGLCVEYDIFFEGSLLKDIPELFLKATPGSHKDSFWWPTWDGKYFLKRYRALHETIQELEQKLKS